MGYPMIGWRSRVFMPPGLLKELAEAVVRDRVESAAQAREAERVLLERPGPDVAARVGAAGRQGLARRGRALRHGTVWLDGGPLR